MPRKRPGAVRATRQALDPVVRQWAHEWTSEGGDPFDRLSPATAAAIRATENGCLVRDSRYGGERYDPDPYREHVRPGRTAAFLLKYREFLRQPGGKFRLEESGCPSCPGCMYEDVAIVRDALETVARLLPPSARTELRRLLSRLDKDFRRRTFPAYIPQRSHATGELLPWWHRRIYK